MDDENSELLTFIIHFRIYRMRRSQRRRSRRPRHPRRRQHKAKRVMYKLLN